MLFKRKSLKNLKLNRSKVKYEHPQTRDECTSWVFVEDITSFTADEEKKERSSEEKKTKVPKNLL